MPAAQIATATAVRVIPVMNTAASNRVIGQMLCIATSIVGLCRTSIGSKS